VVAGAFGIDADVYAVGERQGAELTFAGSQTAREAA